MFVYKNHRIHIAGFSYEIPDGYGLDQIQSEEYQNSLKMVSPDGSIVIAVRPYYRNMPGYVIRDAYSMKMSTPVQWNLPNIFGEKVSGENHFSKGSLLTDCPLLKLPRSQHNIVSVFPSETARHLSCKSVLNCNN